MRIAILLLWWLEVLVIVFRHSSKIGLNHHSTGIRILLKWKFSLKFKMSGVKSMLKRKIPNLTSENVEHWRQRDKIEQQTTFRSKIINNMFFNYFPRRVQSSRSPSPGPPWSWRLSPPGSRCWSTWPCWWHPPGGRLCGAAINMAVGKFQQVDYYFKTATFQSQ